MRILLLGEYSSLFLNLKHGLERLGHEVVLAAWRDGYKRIPVDIDFDSMAPLGLDKILRRINPFISLDKLAGYDVVQIINPYAFYRFPSVNKIFFSFILNNNESVFLSAAGDDAYFWRFSKRELKYGPFDDYLKYDACKAHYHMESERSFEYNKWLVERVCGVIPIMYEYEVAYKQCEKRLQTIPIPMNMEKVRYTENFIGERIKVFHGLNRYGFKGTRHIEKAFDYLERKYPNDIDVLIKGHMPIHEYLELMRTTNIIVDQAYSHSLGVNGIYALAMGKVVLGGAEEEALASIGVKQSPAVNVRPDWKHIVDKIESLLEDRARIPDIGRESRIFCEINHDSVKVANKYLNAWSGFLN